MALPRTSSAQWGELARLVGRDHAQRHGPLWLWVDADLHQRQAPAGCAHVRTPAAAIQLLGESPAERLFFAAPQRRSR